ncbi:hypothetical protein Q7C36_016903 [Tachysurus vachellii]|uniref:Uncharacterized protein n=1 Tax=Tachysurus vachellii TaxID=175792 RepID=A0AA88M8F9_TACVA|nr:hypothetical protein Q7C36_016903 [Tachysurus vachellii]
MLALELASACRSQLAYRAVFGTHSAFTTDGEGAQCIVGLQASLKAGARLCNYEISYPRDGEIRFVTLGFPEEEDEQEEDDDGE